MFMHNTGVKFNQLGSVKYNSQILKTIKMIYSRIGARPIILDQQQRALAILENSTDVILDQEVNSIDELTFSLPFTDSKREFVVNENLVQMFDTIYVIREVKIKKSGNTPFIEVYAEAIWYDLQFSDPIEVSSWEDKTAATILNDILSVTDWSVGNVEITRSRNLNLDEESDNVLKAIAKMNGLFGGVLNFDTVNKRVNLLNETTTHSGASIVYRKNMQDIEATYDTRNLVTKLYLYGAEGVTIEDANNGIPYLENYGYSQRVRVRSIKDERFANPYHLKEFGEATLAVLSRPVTRYSTSAQTLSNLSGLSHEVFTIGSLVRVYDKEILLDVNTRILKWSYNVIEPWNTKVELETTTKTLSDLLAADYSSSETFASEDSLDDSRIIELMVFNYLLNSRADDGFSYWINNGWQVDAINGYSGPASFKTAGELGKKKELKQTIYPSHRDSYSISFRANTKDVNKGPSGRAGVLVKITYDDGTEDEQFVSLI